MDRVDPCSRLQYFLESFKEVYTQSPVHMSSRAVIAEIADIDEEDSTGIVRILSDIFQIPAQIRKELQHIKGLDTTAYEAAVTDIEEHFARLNLDNDAEEFAEGISKMLLRHLDLIGAVMRKDLVHHTLPEEQRKELLDQVTRLMEDVRSEDLDEEFKIFLLDRLNEIHYALSYYQIIGTDQLLASVDKMYGGLLRQSPSISQSKKKIKFAKKLAGIGSAILFTLQVFNQGFELTEHLHDFAGFLGFTTAIEERDNHASSLPLAGEGQTEPGDQS